MIRPDVSFSRAELARRCGWWLRPGVAWTETTSDYADGGTRVHQALAALVAGGVLEHLEDPTLRAMYGYAREWLVARRLGGPRVLLGARAEVPYAYDVAEDTGRELHDPAGETDARWYVDPAKRAAYTGPGGAIRATEVCGRLDLVCGGQDLAGPYMILLDHKCHFGPTLLSAEAQLEIGALALARATGVERVRAAALHLWADREPELEEIGAPGPSGHGELDAAALAAIADRLVFDLEVAGDVPATEGPHCLERHCPAVGGCPVATRAAESAVALIPAERLARPVAHPLSEEPTTEAAGAAQLVAIGLARAVLDQRERQIKALADRLGGLALGDGRVYSGRPVPKEVPVLDVPGAVEALQELGLDFAIEQKTSWAAIREVGGKDGEESARAALRAIGATRRTEVLTYMARPGLAKTAPPANDTETRRVS